RRRASAWIGGGIAVVSLLFLGPLEALLDLAATNGIGARTLWSKLGVTGMPGLPGTTDHVPDQFWWWWRATRVLPNTLSEFPAFSLLLGDLHAHVLALPLGLVSVALAFVAVEGGTPLTWRRWLATPGALVVAALIF